MTSGLWSVIIQSQTTNLAVERDFTLIAGDQTVVTVTVVQPLLVLEVLNV